jgi:FMN phosphatase YigB (HAD superfamily)
MIRAIFFDFYSVWMPDIFSDYLAQAQQHGPVVTGELQAVVNKYFQGEVTPEFVADSFRFKLSRPDIDVNQFTLKETDISPAVTSFMRNLHGHFVKLGVLAYLGPQEYAILTNFNNHNQLFEVITGPLPLHLNAPLLSNEVFAAALQAIGEPPGSCMVVSGNPNYLTFAQSVGMGTLQFSGLPNVQQTLEQILTSELPNNA